MTKFSANLGFLWSELALPEAIYKAKEAGFDAVECHWPYEYAPTKIKTALSETGLSMLSLNTTRGNVGAGDNGLAALVGREHEARHAIDEAIAYADEIDANAIHVMAGCARGEQAHDCFLKNLEYASSNTSRTILIEALNPYDAPGYFLENTHQAANLIKELGVPNLKLMFDCYHVGRTEGDTVGNTEDNVEDRLKALLPIIGHIQFASTPLRGSPDTGELDYKSIFQTLKSFGWNKPLGAEYKPNGPTEDSLGWMQTLV